MLDYNICIICRRKAVDDHHLCFGGNRALSDSDRLMIPICRECHDSIHNEKGGAGNKSKQLGQCLYELKQAVLFGQPEEESRERFLKRYGRSYL